MSGKEVLELWQSFTVTDNVFTGSDTRGILLTSGKGVVSKNTFVGNLGSGMLVLAGDAPIGPLEISDNVFEGNGISGEDFPGKDGLAVESAGPGSVITVSHNHTRNNFRYGIYAAPGLVTDGGGNTSSGNGNPEGCSGVSCLPG